MANWAQASITAADWADDGWFRGPSLSDIHPAYRKTPQSKDRVESKPETQKHLSTSTNTSDSASYPDSETMGSILKLSEIDLEGGGDKIVLPIDFQGHGLIPVYEDDPGKGYNNRYNHYDRRQYREMPPSRPLYAVYPTSEDKARDFGKAPQRAPSSASSQASSHSRPEWHGVQGPENIQQYFTNPRSDPYRDRAWTMEPDNAFAITEAHRSSSPSQRSAFSSPSPLRHIPHFSDSQSARSRSHTISVDNASLPSLSHFSSESDRDGSAKKMKSPRKNKTPPMNKFKRFLKAPQPLIEATKCGDYNEVLRLLAPGAQTHPISAPDKDGLTALHHACRLGYREIAHTLMRRDADIEYRTRSQDRTPLFYAVHAGYADICIDLIQSNADVKAVSKMDGATCLHKASQRGHLDIMRLLIAAGAEVNVKDVEGMPPLMWATQGKKGDAVRLLVENGANLETRIKLGANLESTSSKGLTVLQKVVNGGDRRFAAVLLDLGSDPNAIGPNGMRPLHKAASKGDVELCKVIIDAGGEPGTRSDDGWTALHFAARHGYKEVAHLLIERGCESMVQNLAGETAKVLAEKYGHKNMDFL